MSFSRFWDAVGSLFNHATERRSKGRKRQSCEAAVQADESEGCNERPAKQICIELPLRDSSTHAPEADRPVQTQNITSFTLRQLVNEVPNRSSPSSLRASGRSVSNADCNRTRTFRNSARQRSSCSAQRLSWISPYSNKKDNRQLRAITPSRRSVDAPRHSGVEQHGAWRQSSLSERAALAQQRLQLLNERSTQATAQLRHGVTAEPSASRSYLQSPALSALTFTPMSKHANTLPLHPPATTAATVPWPSQWNTVAAAAAATPATAATQHAMTPATAATHRGTTPATAGNSHAATPASTALRDYERKAEELQKKLQKLFMKSEQSLENTKFAALDKEIEILEKRQQLQAAARAAIRQARMRPEPPAAVIGPVIDVIDDDEDDVIPVDDVQEISDDNEHDDVDDDEEQDDEEDDEDDEASSAAASSEAEDDDDEEQEITDSISHVHISPRNRAAAKRPRFVLSAKERQLYEQYTARGGNGMAEVVTHERSNITVCCKDLWTCDATGWLNDEIINIYMALLQDRDTRRRKGGCNGKTSPKVHFFNSFFVNKLVKDQGYNYKAVARWTKPGKLKMSGQASESVLDCDMIIAPVHLGNHWTCAVIDLSQREIRYLDSFGGENVTVVEALAAYVEDEYRDKRKQEVDTSNWDRVFMKKIPKQTNGWDCGIFTLKFADYQSSRKPFDFHQDDVQNYFRPKVVNEILQLHVE